MFKSRLPLLGIALLAFGCAAPEDDAIDPPEPSAHADTPCTHKGEERHAACFEQAQGACCFVLALPHEYEMQEALKRGDDAEAQREETAMLDALGHGCDSGHDPSCDALEQLASKAN